LHRKISAVSPETIAATTWRLSSGGDLLSSIDQSISALGVFAAAGARARRIALAASSIRILSMSGAVLISIWRSLRAVHGKGAKSIALAGALGWTALYPIGPAWPIVSIPLTNGLRGEIGRARRLGRPRGFGHVNEP
jgi:hypothetical protein